MAAPQIIKIIKNNSPNPITVVGKTLQPNESYQLSKFEWISYSANQLVRDEVTSGNLIVNDGTTDLSPSDGINLLDRFQPDFNEIPPAKFYAQFQIIDDLNFDEYIYSFFDNTGGPQERSGDRSNGYEFRGSSPIICPFDGTVKKGVFAIKGVAVSTGNTAATVTVNLELWKVGFQGEGTKLGDINIDIDSSQNTIGNFWNSSIDTDFTGSNSYNIDVTEGDLLAVKFIRVQNNSNAVEIKNLTVALEIEESK